MDSIKIDIPRWILAQLHQDSNHLGQVDVTRNREQRRRILIDHHHSVTEILSLDSNIANMKVTNTLHLRSRIRLQEMLLIVYRYEEIFSPLFLV